MTSDITYRGKKSMMYFRMGTQGEYILLNETLLIDILDFFANDWGGSDVLWGLIDRNKVYIHFNPAFWTDNIATFSMSFKISKELYIEWYYPVAIAYRNMMTKLPKRGF